MGQRYRNEELTIDLVLWDTGQFVFTSNILISFAVNYKSDSLPPLPNDTKLCNLFSREC